VRAMTWPRVLGGNRVYAFGNDAYYHLRRIVYSVVNFPAVLEFDPYINFPVGAKPIWTPFLDLLVSALVRPWWVLGDGDFGAVERFAVWVPPVLGGVCVVVSYALARRYFGFAPALLTGVVLSFLSAHSWYSQLGFIDHHAAVALVTTLLLAAAMSLLGAWTGGRGGEVWRKVLWTGVLAGCAVLVWPGTLIHLAILECGLFVFLLTRAERGEALRCAAWLAALHAVAFLCVAPFCLGNRWPQWGGLSPVVLSNFQPWFFGFVGAAPLIARGLWTLDALGASRPRRLASLALAGGALFGVSLALLPELRMSAAEAWSWLAKHDHFQIQVAESQPLLFSEGRLDLSVATSRLSYFLLAFPLALTALAYQVRRERERAALWLLFAWGAGLFAVTLLQRRFFNSLSVVLAITLAVSIIWGYRVLAVRLGSSASRRAALGLAAAAVVVSLMLPSLQTYGSHLSRVAAAMRGELLALPPKAAVTRSAIQMSAWLRSQTPPTVGWLDSAERPHYGVLAPWYLGHVIKYVARRPTVVDNFGDDVGRASFAWSQEYYRGTEAEVLPELDARQVRYVVVQRRQEYELEEDPVPETLFHSLYMRDGSRFVGGRAEAGEVPALTRHRLIFESRGLPIESASDLPPIFKVFEVVPGTRVVGRAAPGSEVRIALGLKTNQQREFTYEASAHADARGRYEVRLPYATREGPRSTTTDPAYSLTCDAQMRFLAVNERDVRQGRRVVGPTLCAEEG
jgi:dolichyl-diphosphooligosaccharide--protein glycosyltransferase